MAMCRTYCRPRGVWYFQPVKRYTSANPRALSTALEAQLSFTLLDRRARQKVFARDYGHQPKANSYMVSMPNVTARYSL